MIFVIIVVISNSYEWPVRLAGAAAGALAAPMIFELSKATVVSFAAMSAVFAVWGLAGFGYPSEPLPYALNVVSKILAFVTAASLFLGKRPIVLGQFTGPSHPLVAGQPRAHSVGDKLFVSDRRTR